MLSTFQHKKVLVTGHTGFKGAWLIQLLNHLGAEVTGYARAAADQDLFTKINGANLCSSIIGDVNDTQLLRDTIHNLQPDFIFHLAAQSLVKEGYNNPIETYATNVMGTAHILDALRILDSRCVAVMVTTDKVYENPENGVPFKEDDKLGGYDPYSSSKACDEILIHSFRRSYFSNAKYPQHKKSIASVRAGNVIGGGDMAADRIIPDIVRAINSSKPVILRNPNAVRPWQHVLEPLFAYILLAQRMYEHPTDFNEAYNIGPESNDMQHVLEVTQQFIDAFGNGSYEIEEDNKAQHEAGLLLLDNHKIKEKINFVPKLNAQTAIKWTAEWYADNVNNARDKCQHQIVQYLKLQAKEK